MPLAFRPAAAVILHNLPAAASLFFVQFSILIFCDNVV
jgi:hypothetical protein